jgi:E3 ubiquitin-protein ligase RNF1/2
MGMKECPSCRVHIPSRRSLRPDTTYDTIMEGIYGDIESLEAREAKDIEEFNKKNNMNNSYSQSRHVKKLQQANQRVSNYV